MLVAEQRKLSKQVKVIRLRALAENKRSRKNNYYKKEIYFTEKLGCRMSSSLEFVRESSNQLMSKLRAPEYFGKLLKTEKQKKKQTKSCLILKLWLEQWKTLQWLFCLCLFFCIFQSWVTCLWDILVTNFKRYCLFIYTSDKDFFWGDKSFDTYLVDDDDDAIVIISYVTEKPPQSYSFLSYDHQIWLSNLKKSQN